MDLFLFSRMTRLPCSLLQPSTADDILHGLDRQQQNSWSSTRTSLAWAALAFALLLLWQFLTVRYNRANNWTALFLTGHFQPVPPQLEAGTYRFPDAGYDGQMYRYVAHDPFLQGGLNRYMDDPDGRHRRILVPALAYLLVAGRQSWIDGSYIGVIAGFVGLGAYWLSRWAGLCGLHTAWGLAFLLVPATLVSMDRMTVDVALAALTVGFAYYWTTQSWPKLLLVLLLACLVRETGGLLVGGCCIFELLSKRLGRSLLWASASLPTLAWYAFLWRIFPRVQGRSVPSWIGRELGWGILGGILHPISYPLSGLLAAIARSADAIALSGVLLAMVIATLQLRVRPLSPLALAGFLHVVLALALTRVAYWEDCNEYARVFSPLLILVALQSSANRMMMTTARWLSLAPVIMVDLRLGIQFSSSIGGVLRGLLRL
jgi:hypothetical protein